MILSPHRAAFFQSILFQVVTLTNLHWFLYPCHLKTTLSVDGDFPYMPGLPHCLMSQASAHISSRRMEKIPRGAFPASWFDRMSPHASSWHLQLVSRPRGGEFRVHHMQFPNQLLSPQEAMCCIIKGDASNHGTILKHSSRVKKKKKKVEWRGGHNDDLPPHCYCFPQMSALPQWTALWLIGEREHLLFWNLTFILKGVLLHLLGMAMKHSPKS